MNLLALSAQIPYPPHHGKAMRDYHLLTGLARRHRVHLLCMAGDPAEAEQARPLADHLSFEVLPRPCHGTVSRLGRLLFSTWPDLFWRTWSGPFCRRLAARVAADPPDLLLVEGLEMAPYALWLQKGRPGLPWVLDGHNAEYLLQRRAWEIARRSPRSWPAALYSRLQAARLARHEARACRLARGVVAVSPQDRQALLRIAPQARIAVVPNGLDTGRYRPPGPRPADGPPLLLFTGHMGYRPNVDAVLWFCREVWPQVRRQFPQARLRIVGREPAPAVCALAGLPGVEVTGPVPDDRPHIAAADLYVLPMRFGGGIRFKLLQALAMERAVLSTTAGAEGVEGLEEGRHLLLADDPDAFARKAVGLLEDPDLRRRLGQAGRALVVRHYDWRVLLPRFEAALQAALEREG